ncbi:MAG: hypothetical protein ACOC7U_03355 [Spirochaetota bacterium]
MKKVLLVVGIVVALAALFFASPMVGKMDKNDTQYYGTAVADEGGGGGI